MFKKLFFLSILFVFSGLEAQKIGLNLADDEDYTSFSSYKEVLDSFTVFVNGENHQYTKSNAEIQLKMFKYLHQNAGVNTLLLELGWSRGYILTQYIQTGDTTLLPAIRGYSWKYYADFVESLKSYNDSLPADNKIQIVGIDVERFYNMSVKALQMQLPKENLNSKLHDSISLCVQSIHALNTYLETSSEWDEEKEEYVYKGSRGPSVSKSIYFILENIKSHKDKYLALIEAKNHAVFLKVVEQLEDMQKYEKYDYSNSVQGYVYREQYMYDQFTDLFEKDTTEKFFMQFGRCHSVKVYQKEACGWHHYHSIANRINESNHPKLKNRVLSTAIYYPDSDSWGKLEDSLKNHVQEMYIDSSFKDSLTLWNVQLDSVFDGRHEFVIINNKELKTDKDPKAKGGWDDYDADGEEEADGYITFKTGYNAITYNDLNSYIGTNAHSIFQPTFQYGIDLSFLDKENGFYLGLAHTRIVAKKIFRISDDLRIKPRYWHLDLGKDLFVKKQKFDLIPYLGLGVEHLGILQNHNTINGLLGNNSQTKVSSVAFNAKLGIKMQFDFEKTAFGLETSYLRDIGNAKWSKSKIKGSPTWYMSNRGLVSSVFFALKF
jgi:hypothetical protein